MKILLINSNPVVSRLTALSARKESVPLDEIKDIADLKKSNYNIVFVDSESLSPEILTILKNADIKRRVIFYTQDDKDNIDDIFNYTILKPFLPSEVSSILREAKMELDEEEHSRKIEKKVEKKVTPPKEEYLDLKPLKIKEEKKYDILKGSEEELLKELNESKTSLNKPKIDLEDDLLIKDDKKEPTISKNELFELDDKKDDSNELFTLDKDSSRENIKNDILDLDIDNSKKEIKDNILNLDIDSSDEVKVEKKIETPKKEESKDSSNSKVLEEKDKRDIQSLLNKKEEETPKENLDENLSLDDVITTTSPAIAMDINNNKKEEIKSKNNKKDKVMKKVFKDTVGSLPIEELRQLLRGTKIHITIEFPKEV